jgi:DNA-binding CsgD family transcriptional regulator
MSESNGSNDLLAAVEQLTNLLAIAMTKDLKQVDAIRLLGRSSLSNAQIAAILGSTPDSIRAERNRLKREAAKPLSRKGPAADVVVEG